ncbi:hypothetical protein RCO27_18770 [Sphingosinicella sp. LHD-64]|uniref:hypothetical protein n=1 Tax=Sphingosinicella sp. LHD-64 TaxID=3072139 RepID=UPI00280EEB6A|nr:hypothetical protein [Sphingosinicella sp. LHD-64]MDQ8758277.1 hypothetical protein [Sphingosinicella sp. LHD-64]
MTTDARITRRLTRRSFLACVVGGAAASGALANPPSRTPATRQMVVDGDPSDPARPVPVTDSDAGPQSDRPGLGRRRGAVRPSRVPDPPPAPSVASPEPTPPGGPRSSFVICPGHPRCPK